ncbi:Intraflagellar transport protein 81, partial [Borealophlyctis nickersoniae]
MTTSSDLKLIVDRLSQPPFSRTTLSVIQLHDELEPFQLLQLLNDVVAHVDDANPSSPHRDADLRVEAPEDTVWRLGEFLRMLKYKGAADGDAFRQSLLDGDRTTILAALAFLLKDLATHKKRAYLAPFLASVEVPPEFLQDDVTLDLTRQLEELQTQFKETHKVVDQMRQSGNNAGTLKREIQQMEEEKQQVLSKIAKIRKKVEEVPNHEQWLEAAKNLRIEQQNEAQIAERIKEQRNQVAQADRKLAAAQQTLKDVRATISPSGPDVLFSKLDEDVKMNKYLATENLPKQIEDAKQHLRELTQVLSEPAMSDRDLRGLEGEIKELNEVIAKLAEKRLLKSTTGDDKLALFRQQAAIIGRKKEGTAAKLKALNEEVAAVTAELAAKKEAAKGAQGAKMLKGEEFKRYVSELRGKSTIYKRKKQELAEVTAEFGILQRTEE